MAKLDKRSSKTSKKKTNRKRQHSGTDTEDEVAPKSLVVEYTGAAEQKSLESHQLKFSSKAVKRKSIIKGDIKKKRVKKDAAVSDIDSNNDEDAAATEANDVEMPMQTEDKGLHTPSLQEILDSTKPENVNAIQTVRQKKKLKHQQRLDSLKGHVADKEKLRNQDYLHKWKYARTEWKFEKLRQVSIQQAVFDKLKINNDLWPIALEYLSATKGGAKAKIMQLAESVIEQSDKECANQEEQQKLFDSVKYKRARELLQSFN